MFFTESPEPTTSGSREPQKVKDKDTSCDEEQNQATIWLSKLTYDFFNQTTQKGL